MTYLHIFLHHKERLAQFTDEFLNECVAYSKEHSKKIWLDKSRETRYRDRKWQWLVHDDSATMPTGAITANNDGRNNTGCIPTCRFYEPEGTISDTEMLEILG